MKLPVHESALALTLKGHPALGVWKYLNGYTREIAEDGQVTLRSGKECDLETPLYFQVRK